VQRGRGHPAIYPARPDLAPGLRMAVHGRYLVLFRELPGENAVRVERVLHGARTSCACSSRWRFGASGRCQARPSDGAGQIRQARDL
jgi:hypothetical protein